MILVALTGVLVAMVEQINLKVFLEKLINDDKEAWLLLKEKVEEFLRENGKFNGILNRTSHPHDEFVDELILHLKEDNKRRLRECKVPEAFWGWLNRVELTVLDKLTNNKRLILFNEYNTEQDQNSDELDNNPGVVEKAKEEFNRKVRQQEVLERLQITRNSFEELWKEDSLSTFIMFARFELDIPSRDVGTLLGISGNYVDVMVTRAREKLREKESKWL